MDLTRLRPVYGHPGPYVTVCFNVSKDTDKAIGGRWDNARKQLADQGAGERTLRAIDGVVGSDAGEGGTRGQVVIAAGGDIVYDALVDDPPQDYTARVAPLPDPMPLLARRATSVPYVLVLADSVGADLAVVDAGGRHHHTSVGNDDFPIPKPRSGTGSEQEKQIQRNVDENLKDNQKKVAAEAQRLATASEAELVIVAGDPVPQQTLLEVLADRRQVTIVKAEHGHRAAGFTDESLHHEIGAHLREHLQHRMQAVVADFEHQRGIGERATEGLAATIEALRQGRVETLLWNPDPDELGEQRIWTGSQPEHLALTAEELYDMLAPSGQQLSGMNVPKPHRVDLASALVRAAAGLGSGLQFVSDEAVKLSDGIGAVLRGTTPALSTGPKR